LLQQLVLMASQQPLLLLLLLLLHQQVLHPVLTQLRPQQCLLLECLLQLVLVLPLLLLLCAKRYLEWLAVPQTQCSWLEGW
jgi:hypothetical protein